MAYRVNKNNSLKNRLSEQTLILVPGALFLAFFLTGAETRLPVQQTVPVAPKQVEEEEYSDEISDDSKPTLLREYKRALELEQAAFLHRMQIETHEFTQSLEIKKREWDSNERSAKNAFFERNTGPKERRLFLDEARFKRKDFEAVLVDQVRAKKEEHSKALELLKKDQADKMREFTNFIDRGKRPPERLWPKSTQ